MNRQRLFRMGPCLFAACLAWYLGSTLFLKHLRAENLAAAKMVHKSLHLVDVGTADSVSIHSMGDVSVDVVFDPAARQVKIRNKDLGKTIDAHVRDGVVTIALQMVQGGYDGEISTVSITLPVSVNRVGFSGVGGVKLAGLPGAAIDALHLTSVDCKPKVEVEKLTVGSLNFVSACKENESSDGKPSGFGLGEDVDTGRLEVSLPVGYLRYDASRVPQKVLLNLGDKVEISGRSEFVRSARIGPFSTPVQKPVSAPKQKSG